MFRDRLATDQCSSISLDLTYDLWCFRLGLDEFEKKFGGKQFNDPANVEKNRALNENILKRLKQIVMLVM